MSSSGSVNPSDLSHSLTCSGTQYSSSSPCTAHLPRRLIHYAERYAPVPNCRYSRLSRSRLHRSPRMCICTRAKAPSYGCYLRYCRQRHPCSCLCGLHKQAPRAKVARSSAQPKGLCSASRRQSRRSCSASQPGRRARSRPHRTARRRPARLAPRSGSPAGGSASAATGASVPLSPSAPLQARYGRCAPSAVFPRAPQAPFRVLLRRERAERRDTRCS